MLKIKDNVDLKELEKFGFRDEGVFWYKKDIFYTDIDIASIGINKDDRKIQIAFSVIGNSCFYTYDIDILFDLIQAGLVEKVGGKSE
jgi:hypothetical protein